MICDRTEDIQCMKKGTDALVGKTDDQLIALTQENLKTATLMVQKRAQTADAQGLPCYKKFYDKYVTGLQGILLNTSETDRLAKAKTPEERSGAIKALAALTQSIMCDENWRAIHFNETIASAKCTGLEMTNSLDLMNFSPKLLLLENGMLLGKLVLIFKNNVMSGIIGEVSPYLKTN